MQIISSSNLPFKFFTLQAALSIDILLMIPFALFLKYSTPSYAYTLWDIKLERYVSLVPQSHGFKNLVTLLISVSHRIKLFHVGKVTVTAIF